MGSLMSESSESVEGERARVPSRRSGGDFAKRTLREDCEFQFILVRLLLLIRLTENSIRRSWMG